MSVMTYLTIVIPVFNEAPTLKANVERALKTIRKSYKDFELIIANNASTDGSDKIGIELSKRNKEVVFLHLDIKGRGIALRTAFKKARGKIVMYMDADLATDLKHVPELVEKIENGYDFATGSRLLPSSKVMGRRITREIASWGYNYLCRFLFEVPIHDLQCGFKAFNKNSLMKIIDEVEDTQWVWDTETFVRGYKKGFKIGEIPIKWVDRRGSKVRMKNDIIEMGSSILRLYLTLRKR